MEYRSSGAQANRWRLHRGDSCFQRFIIEFCSIVVLFTVGSNWFCDVNLCTSFVSHFGSLLKECKTDCSVLTVTLFARLAAS